MTITIAIIGDKTSDEVFARIDKIIDLKAKILVGDKISFDFEVQQYLHSKAYAHVVVHCPSAKPKRNVGYPVKAGYISANVRDIEICHQADFLLVAFGGKRATKSIIDTHAAKARVVSV